MGSGGGDNPMGGGMRTKQDQYKEHSMMDFSILKLFKSLFSVCFVSCKSFKPCWKHSWGPWHLSVPNSLALSSLGVTHDHIQFTSEFSTSN